MLDHLRDNKDTLVVWRLDRLGRSLHHLVAMIRDLQERGVGFRSLTESIDTTTATGRLIFHVFSSLAEFERDLLAERSRAGLEAARAQGRLGGRPSIMTPERVAAARQLIADGTDVAAVARTIGVSRATIYRHMDRAEPTS